MADKIRQDEKQKKAQMEIFGLAIIVVLLSFGMIIMISYSSSGVPSEVKEMNEEQAYKFINTLLHSTSDCNEMTVQELILDVAENAPYGSVVCLNGMGKQGSEYLNETLVYVLDNTLDKWKSGKYQFAVYLNENVPIYFFGTNNCKQRTGKEYPLPMKSGTPVYVRLNFCG